MGLPCIRLVACETALRDHRQGPVASLGYAPRDAVGTVLHQVVREHLETFLATAARADPGGLPGCLEEEFRAFLECGVWSPSSTARPRRHGAANVEHYLAGLDDIVAGRRRPGLRSDAELGARGEYFSGVIQFCFTATRCG